MGGSNSGSVVATLARHRAFWSRAETDRPLAGMTRWSQITSQQFDWDLPRGEGILEPDMLQVEHFLPQYEALFQQRGPLDDDLIWPAMPPTAIPWLEAMLGCPIGYSLPSGSFHAYPVPDEGRLAVDPFPLSANPWFRKLVEFLNGLAQLSRGRFAVGVPLMRGPWDLVAATCGMAELYTGLYDDPDRLRRLAGTCANLWVQATRGVADAIPRWRGGYVSFLGIWGPTFNPIAQDDASVSVSPELYRRIMSSADRTIARAWKRPIFHLHSAGLQVLDDVLPMLGGRALNVDIDPSGPPIEALLPVLRKVQARSTPLHLLVFDRDQATVLRSLLAPAGLAVTYQPVDPAAEMRRRT